MKNIAFLLPALLAASIAHGRGKPNANTVLPLDEKITAVTLVLLDCKTLGEDYDGPLKGINVSRNCGIFQDTLQQQLKARGVTFDVLNWSDKQILEAMVAFDSLSKKHVVDERMTLADPATTLAQFTQPVVIFVAPRYGGDRENFRSSKEGNYIRYWRDKNAYVGTALGIYHVPSKRKLQTLYFGVGGSVKDYPFVDAEFMRLRATKDIELLGNTLERRCPVARERARTVRDWNYDCEDRFDFE